MTFIYLFRSSKSKFSRVAKPKGSAITYPHTMSFDLRFLTPRQHLFFCTLLVSHFVSGAQALPTEQEQRGRYIWLIVAALIFGGFPSSSISTIHSTFFAKVFLSLFIIPVYYCYARRRQRAGYPIQVSPKGGYAFHGGCLCCIHSFVSPRSLTRSSHVRQ